MEKSYRVVVPDRFLSTQHIDGTVTISCEGDQVASSDRAIALLEGDRSAVVYLPISDMKSVRLLESDRQFQCRWKGKSRYYHVELATGKVVHDGAWGYPDAPNDVALLRDRISFETSFFDVQLPDTGMPL